ncbi:MAG: hypothetical protein IJT50_09740 [Lentisphaeria bacterium]|nr:hypothetical protein [Lentisphaeria bacterium]
MKTVSPVTVFLSTLLAVAACGFLGGAEYFVEKHGSDANDGTSPERPKATIRAAVKLLRPGDTLTIGPGEYFEAVAGSFAQESTGKPILVRARFPGSVLIRGDREIKGRFSAVPGFRFVHAVDFPQAPNAVNERDTLRILTPAGALAELEFSPGTFFYDEKEKKLYISTTDGLVPDRHFYTASLLFGGGFYMLKSSYVTLDGLMATGFYTFNRLPHGHCWGLRLSGKTDGVIRNCKAFFNSNGIHFGMERNSVIEDSVVYANGSPAPVSGGNMVVWGHCHGNTVRRCRSFFSAHPSGLGIRFYGGNLTGNRLEDNVSFGECGIGVKGSIDRDPAMRNICFNNYNERQFASSFGDHNVFRRPNAYAPGEGGLRLDLLEKAKADFDSLFADPDNHDFRPQEGARGIEAGLIDRKDVFFVSPKGDDGNSGRSVAKPWKTFRNVRPGSTVYLLPGTYDFPAVIAADRVTLKTRGTGPRAVLTGGLTVSGRNCRVEGVNFLKKGALISGDSAFVSCCGFGSPLTVTGKAVEICHNAFVSPADLTRATGSRHSNLYAVATPPGGVADLDKPHAKPQFTAPEKGDFTVRNPRDFAGRGFDALPVGPYRLVRECNAAVRGPFVRRVSDTTADIEWWTSESLATSELRWGETPRCTGKAGSAFRSSNYHTVTLSGLKPGKKYYFKLFSRTPPREFHSNMELAAADLARKRRVVTSEVGSFTTQVRSEPPRTFFVSPEGRDGDPGSADSPFRTINAALWKAGPGDTVMVRGGIYTERIRFRSGGDKGKTLTLRSYPGEKVFLDGKMILFNAIDAEGKSHIVIDGFYFRNIVHKAEHGAVMTSGGSDVVVRRCFYDGRSRAGYTPPFIVASQTGKLLFADNVIMGGFTGSAFWRCPDLVMRNNVFYINSIVQTYIHCHPEDKVTIARNIFYDLIPAKYFMNMIGLYHVEALKEEYNCFYPRMPAEGKGIFRVTRAGGKPVEKRFNYPDMRKLMGSRGTSLTVNPKCPVLKELASFREAPPIMHQYMTLGRKNPPDFEAVSARGPEEMHLVKGVFEELDFKDFFAAEPAVVKIGAGLRKEFFHPAGGIR